MASEEQDRSSSAIPDHELLRRIGGGSYGEVWLARNVMGTLRAIKILLRQSFEERDAFDREFSGLQKFEPVSRTHEGLVDILQIGRSERRLYYVMELADDGRESDREMGSRSENKLINDHSSSARTSQHSNATIWQYLNLYVPRTLRFDLTRHGRLPAEKCVEIGLKLTSALAHLHGHGLVHRDVKPSNIIFVNSQPRLADIGLVAETSEAHSYVGTMGFIPPEGPGTPQADLYSLGKVLYELSTGRNQRDYPNLPPGFHELPDYTTLIELNQILLKACETNPKLRYKSAKEMHGHLLRVRRGESIRQIRWMEKALPRACRVAAIVFVLALLGIVIQQQIKNNEQPSSSPDRIRPGTMLMREGQYLPAVRLFAKDLERHRGQKDQEQQDRSNIASALWHLPVPGKRYMNINDGPRLRFSPDGTGVLLLGPNRTVDVYSRERGEHHFSMDYASPVLGACFSLDGQRILTVTPGWKGLRLGECCQEADQWTFIPRRFQQSDHEFDNDH